MSELSDPGGISKFTQEVSKRARYYTLGDNDSDSTFWFVCHGYGQLAKYFIQHFAPIREFSIENSLPCPLIIAPEGLSRFYLGNNYERVGASWMTKEDRLDEIEDQMIFLNLVFEKYFSGQNPNPPKWIALGFSQGTATIWRWISRLNIDQRPHALILWAGMIPLEFEKISPFVLHGMKLFFVYGDSDEFITPEKVSNLIQTLNQSHLPYEIIQYSGGHTINREALLEIYGKIKN